MRVPIERALIFLGISMVYGATAVAFGFGVGLALDAALDNRETMGRGLVCAANSIDRFVYGPDTGPHPGD